MGAMTQVHTSLKKALARLPLSCTTRAKLVFNGEHREGPREQLGKESAH